MPNRTAKKTTLEEFKNIFHRETMEIDGGYSDDLNLDAKEEIIRTFIYDSKKIQKDLSKIDFRDEYVSFDPNEPSSEGAYSKEGDLVGFQTLPNGFCFFGILAGGDCDLPVFYILYYDGKYIRAYIPEDGNCYNSLTKRAYGQDEDTDLQDLRNKWPDEFKEAIPEFSKEMYGKDYDDLTQIEKDIVQHEISESIINDLAWHIDWDKIKEDIMSRIIFQDIPINPRIEERPDWDTYFTGMCEVAKARSLDPNTQVGSVIVDKRNRIVTTGYNSYPPNCKDEELPYGREGENSKYPWMVHGEMNAITSCGKDLEGCTVYVPFKPCPDCMKAIITSGIKCVKYYGTYSSGVNNDELVDKMAKMSGVELKKINVKVPKIIWE